jgi:hypothetical protein
LARPFCLRCQKARISCAGPRGITIVPYGGIKNTARSSVNAVEDDWRSPTERVLDLNITRTLAVPYDEVYQAFTHSRLLSGLDTVPRDSEFDGAIAGKCFLALSTTYFGIKHHEKAVTSHGLSRYSSALQTVHKALGDESASRSFDLLEAIVIMQVTEVCTSLVKRNSH